MTYTGDTPGYPRFHTKPLVVPVVSGYMPEQARGRRGIFAPPAPSMREERVPVPTREVVCYECGRRSNIPTAALSAHCVHCQAHLNTADVVLKPGSRRLNIRTLGDVSVPTHVELSQLSIVCRNLIVSGKAVGNLHCTGELVLRGQAVVEGQVLARSLLVAVGAQAACAPSIAVETALIEGQLAGRVHAMDSVHIGRAGQLRGDCRAEHVSVEPGGLHIGEWIRTNP